jgi:hypothetical protein
MTGLKASSLKLEPTCKVAISVTGGEEDIVIDPITVTWRLYEQAYVSCALPEHLIDDGNQ